MLITELNKKRQSISFTPTLFTLDEVQKMIDYGESLHQLKSDAYGDPDEHNMDIAWIECNEDTSWIFNRILPLMANWPITRMQNLQYSTYRPGGGLAWHVDYLEQYPPDAPSRIVGSMILLTDPDEFEGGEFQYSLEDVQYPDEEKLAGSIKSIPKMVGSIAVLDKDTWHRVSEITGGVRKTIIAWGLK